MAFLPQRKKWRTLGKGRSKIMLTKMNRPHPCGELGPLVEKPVENVENFVISTAISRFWDGETRENWLYIPLYKGCSGVVFVVLCRRVNPMTFFCKHRQKVGGFAKKHISGGADRDLDRKIL